MDQPLTTTIAAIKTQTPTCSQKSIHQNFNHDATHSQNPIRKKPKILLLPPD